LPRRRDQRRRGAGQKAERKQQARRGAPEPHQEAEARDQQRHGDLHRDQEPPPIDDVGERTRRQREHEHRRRGCDLHQRDDQRIRIEAGHQPAGRGVLHPDADIGHDGRDPQHRERGVAEWIERRAFPRRARASVCRFGLGHVDVL
jgi:hypothetical protein